MKHTIQNPDGQTIEIEAPEGATAEQLIRFAQTQVEPVETVEPPSVMKSFGAGIRRQSERMTGGVIDTYRAIRNVASAPFSDEPYPGFMESQYGPQRQASAEYEQQAEQDMAKHRDKNPVASMLGQAAYLAPMGGVNTVRQAALSGAGVGLADYQSDPASDAIGGAFGFKAGEQVSNLAKSLLTPAPKSAAVSRAVKRGYEMSPAERSGSRMLEKIEMGMDSMPFMTDVMNRPRLDNQDMLNMQYLQEIGLPNVRKGDKVTGDALNQAKTSISKSYDDALTGQFLAPDKQFKGALTEIYNRDIDLPVKSPDVKGMIDGVVKGFKDGTLDGKRYQRFRSSLLQAAKNVQNSPSNTQPGYAPALFDTVRQLDELAERSLPDTDMRSINRQYRMLKTGTTGATPPVNVDTGDLSASKFRNKLNKDGAGYKYGTDETGIYDTIHAMNSFPRSAGNSGTAERVAMQKLTDSDSKQLARQLLGNVVGRAYTGKYNPIGRMGRDPDILKGVGAVAGVGPGNDQVSELLKILLNEEQK